MPVYVFLIRSRCALLSGVLLFLTACAFTPSTVLVNNAGQVHRCAAYGYGVAGILTADAIHTSCVADLKRLDYVPVPTVALGLGYAPGLTTITQIVRDSGADRAGLQVGDEITWIGSQRTERLLDIFRALQDRHAGEQVPITFRREGLERTVMVSVQTRGAGQP